jgi:disintegrin and metalloproteinase domain-containing protein 17
MEDGVITANIETKEDIYHIEPSWRHLPDTDDQTMIAYKESDIKFSWTEPDENNVIPPKVCDFVRENGTASGVEEGEEEMEEGERGAEAGEGRTKRSSEPFYTSAGEGSLRQTRCPLLLVADYR